MGIYCHGCRTLSEENDSLRAELAAAREEIAKLKVTPLATKHKGMKISLRGLANNARINAREYKYMLQELFKHASEMATRYYAGDIAVVDEFCQLYCLGEKERAALGKEE